MSSDSNKYENSVGIVKTQFKSFEHRLQLTSGQYLKEYQIAYETYGHLNLEKNNAILICHALSGNQHAAGFHHSDEKKPGWWEVIIGPGKPIDTNKYFVVCSNNLGGCHGSTGPKSINPATNQRYGPEFPVVTVEDWVASQANLADFLGIDCWAAVIGGSLGGMQALQWAIKYPNRIKHAIIIAAAAKLSAQNIAFNEIARQAIMSDQEFHQGHYYQHQTAPKKGLMLARMLGHVTYLSEYGMRAKFGRELQKGSLNFDFDAEFQVESYLRYQGEHFSENFDANTYLLMTKALDYFDPAANFNNDLTKALAGVQCQFFLMSFSSDWRFAPNRSEEIVNALIQAKKNVSYAMIDAPQGHDSFLLRIPRYLSLFSTYMDAIL